MGIFANRVVTNSNVEITKYKFNIKDPVYCTKYPYYTNFIILSRYRVNGINYYKVGYENISKLCKESELLNR